MLLLSGFVPARHRRRRSPTILAAFALATAATLVVAVPLADRSAAAVSDSRRVQAVNGAVVTWLSATTGMQLLDVTVDGSRVTVDVAGSSPPPPSDPLREAVSRHLGADAAVSVRWFQQGAPTAAAKSPVLPISNADLRALIDHWLATSPSGRDVFDIIDVSRQSNGITVDIAGPIAPPAVGPLARAVEARVGKLGSIRVRWTERHDFNSTELANDPLTSMRRVADAWVRARAPLELVGTVLDVDSVTVDLAGPAAPGDADSLVAALRPLAGPHRKVIVRFTERRVLATALRN